MIQTAHVIQRPNYFTLNPESDLADGLLFAGLGRFPGSLRFDDATESLWGGGIAGTLTNMEPGTDWVFDQYLGRWALDFDGSDDRVYAPVATPTAAVTVAAWLLRGRIDYLEYLAGQGDNASHATTNLRLSITATNQCVWYCPSAPGTNRIVTATDLLVADTTSWHHLCGTYDGAVQRIYLDGVQSAVTSSWSAALNAVDANMAFGACGTYTAREWLGRLTDCLVYNRALSLPEIQTLANPADPMLGGLILPPARKLWPVATTETPPAVNYRPIMFQVC